LEKAKQAADGQPATTVMSAADDRRSAREARRAARERRQG
jgi:hypothetical protein